MMDDESIEILVVDDDSTNLLLLQTSLEESRTTKFVLTGSTCLEEALGCLKDKHFDAVLLHLRLPDSRGIETFVQVQREHPALPILILSGVNDEALAIQAVQAGAQDFLAKGDFRNALPARSIRYAIERKRSEERLIASETDRDRFFTLSLDMLGIFGADGYMKRLNPAFGATLGYSDAELMAVPFLTFVHPDDHAATLAEMTKLRSGLEVMSFENRYRHRDGSFRWLSWKVAPYEDLWYAAAHDVTGKKEAATALLQAKDQLETRVQERTSELANLNAVLKIQIAEREEAEAEIRARARQQEAVAELGRLALTDVDIDTLLQGATQLVEATLQVEMSTVLELLPAGDSLRIRTRTGWRGDANNVVVPNNSQSQAGYVLQMNTPVIVTDLRTETRFQPSQHMLEQGIVSGLTVIVGDPEEPFGTLGAHSVKMRQFTQDDIHFLQSVSNVLAAALEQRRVEVEIRQLNSQLNETNERLKLENAERQEAMEDAQRARESADFANRSKSDFLSRMSHELRTPLNAILGFGQILEKQNLAPLATESIGYILKGGRHLLNLINEVLDIARVEAGHLELSLEPIALDDVLPEACALVRPLAAERNIRLTEGSADLGGCHVLADRQRLIQVLINLLSNAIKYNRESGQVEVSCLSKPGGRITITVRDTGPGISSQDMAKLFTPFERLDASNSDVEGTGLGLVLSQRLVVAMGGTLHVDSTLGLGTAFTIDLPQTASATEQLTNVPEATHSCEISQQTERTFSILCFEDNPSNLRLVEAILSGRKEITLLAAMQGSVGLDLARQHEPDLILLDLNLPDLHGSEVLSRLQQSSATKDIPVVVVSADATPKQIERLLGAGARAYLTKPLDVGDFLDTLDKFLLQTLADTV